jgi:hypothetical protein
MAYKYKRAAIPAAKSKKFSTKVVYTGKIPTITAGPLPGAGKAKPAKTGYKTAAPGIPISKPAASQAKLKAAAKKSGARMKAPGIKTPRLTAAQQKLVLGAMPKAKAQRSAAEIAAMHAYRAAGGGAARNKARAKAIMATGTQKVRKRAPKKASRTLPYRVPKQGR